MKTKETVNNLFINDKITLEVYNLLLETLKLDLLTHENELFDISSELEQTILLHKIKLLDIKLAIEEEKLVVLKSLLESC